MVLAHTLVEETGSLFGPDVRTVLISVLVLVDVVLVVITLNMSRRQLAQRSTISAMQADSERRTASLAELAGIARQHLDLLAELNGHADVAFGRARLTPRSRELLEQAERN